MEATYFVVEPNRDQLTELARLVDEGVVKPLIDSVFPLAEARSAFERVMEPDKRGKVGYASPRTRDASRSSAGGACRCARRPPSTSKAAMTRYFAVDAAVLLRSRRSWVRVPSAAS